MDSNLRDGCFRPDSLLYLHPEGIRTGKTVNGVTTAYTMDDDSNIVSQTDGTDTLTFTRDSNGSLQFLTLNGVKYTYETNAQGDVSGLLGSDGKEVVNYVYDSWGNPLSIGGSLAGTVGAKNPFRYRGYYYDAETGLYYLQSRYYDPEIGRFISKDDASCYIDDSGIDANLYVYCSNNPVENLDPTGHLALRVDVIVNGVDLIVTLIPLLAAVSRSLKALRGTGQTIKVYQLLKPAITRIQVAAAKYLSGFGIKVSLAVTLTAIINNLLKYSHIVDKYFPYGLSIGGVVALVLTQIFPTYKARQRAYIWWGSYGLYLFIKFW